MAVRLRGIDLVANAPGTDKDEETRSGLRPSEPAGEKDPYEYAYLDLRGCLERVRQDVLQTGTFDIKSVYDRIAVIAGNPEALFGLYRHTSLYGHERDYILSHLINVMIYSMRIARKMGCPADGLADIGLAAALHDTGMFRVPQEILEKPERLTDEENAEVKKHTCAGGNILARYKEQFPLLPCVAEQHHEREDGSGYPAGLSGEAMHAYAKIVALADTYEAMTHDRPHRKALSVRALLDSGEKSKFSKDVMKAFLDAIQLYPIGSLVVLSTGAVCRVVDTNMDNPIKPIVQEEMDAQGRRVRDGRVLNLRDQRTLAWVTKALEEDDPRAAEILGREAQ